MEFAQCLFDSLLVYRTVQYANRVLASPHNPNLGGTRFTDRFQSRQHKLTVPNNLDVESFARFGSVEGHALPFISNYCHGLMLRRSGRWFNILVFKVAANPRQ